VYAIAGITRQGYAQHCTQKKRRAAVSQVVVGEVQRIRAELPWTGGRKLWKGLRDRFVSLGLKIGRNRLFSILGAYGLLIKRRRQYARTTNSRHGFAIARNELAGLRLSRANQAWVSDITYLRTRSGFVYASLITDAYSRKIIGYDVSTSLSIEGSLRALQQALRQCRKTAGVLHHSDRGVQYCSTAYRQALAKRGVIASMAAVGNPYENAIAERVNGIMKQEFGLDGVFPTLRAARKALKQAVRLYNTRRLHQSLNYCVPDAMHAGQALLSTLVSP
jgi:transposase InsO family protein